MAHYLIAVGTQTGPDRSWAESYVTEVPAVVERHGGRYLAWAFGSTTVLEGDVRPPGGFAVVEFPNEDAATAFYDDPDYVRHREARMEQADTQIYLVPGL